MELMNGYKKTELGVIPEDWKLLSIDQIFEFHSTSNYSKSQMLVDGEIGCFHYGLIHSLPNFNYDIRNGVRYYVTEKQAKYEFIKDGDIVMVDASEDLSGVNKSIEVSGVQDKLVISGLHTYLLRDKGYYVDGFRGLVLNSYKSKAQFYRLAVGMKVFGVSKKQLKTVILPIPSNKEQIAIAAALSDADAYITNLEKLIEKKKAIKQGVMQELLKPKDGWQRKKLGDIADVVSGGTPSSFVPEYWNGEINWFSPTEIGSEKYTFESVRKISKLGLANSSAKILPIGTILLTSRAGIGDLSILKIEATTNQGFQSLVVKEGNYNEFVYYLMQILKSELIKNASGSTFLEISPSKVRAIEVVVPRYDQQVEIAVILSEIDRELQILEHKLQKAKSIKLGMMQNLLTGKIRLD